MKQQPTLPSQVATLRGSVLDRTVAALQIYGVNSLKTLDPPLAALNGDVIIDLSAPEPTERLLVITLRQHTITVDLARTGTATFLTRAEPWVMSPRSTPPTARIIFTDGSGIDFKEPARTKRITFALRSR